jgi:ADP-heptose:LPS heptosyltransferase
MKQVLIINITRMGDLVQTGPLIAKLHREWPEAAVDVVVNTTFAPVAAMLPGLRHVLAYDFEAVIEESRVHATDVVDLYTRAEAWAKPLAEAGYDRVVNLTFNPRSAYLTAYVGAPDTRGATIAPDGALAIRDPWLSYFVERRHHRRFNRFNLVDIYALGGSGPAPFVPLALTVDPAAKEWASCQLHAAARAANREPPTANGQPSAWVAIQVGASETIKAWRPRSFGHTMATISRLRPVGFVLIGTTAEVPAVQEALAAYRAATRTTGCPPAPVCDMVGRTDVPQLTALLAQCRLLLTNDTGPMHLAVSVGTPVVDLSVGHVDFHETGPYGPGHWVIQPDLDCAPCEFDRICPHQACKDRVVSEHVADLCLHVLSAGPFPAHATGVRIYESGVDEDGLGCFRLRAGREDALTSWYGSFWRRYWYEAFTGRASLLPEPDGAAPDAVEVGRLAVRLLPIVQKAAEQMQQVARLCRRPRPPVAALRATSAAMQQATEQAVTLMRQSPAFAPLATAFLREQQEIEGVTLRQLAEEQAVAYLRLCDRVAAIARAIRLAGDEPSRTRPQQPITLSHERSPCHAHYA